MRIDMTKQNSLRLFVHTNPFFSDIFLYIQRAAMQTAKLQSLQSSTITS